MPRLSSAPARCAVILASATALACAQSVSLAGRVVDAGAFTETAEIDLGSEPARVHLIDGWSPLDERWLGREDETFVWGLDGGATLEIWFMHLIDRSITVRFRPHTENDIPVFESLHVTVNGGPLPPVPVQSGWQEVELQIPERFQLYGPNAIAFGYDAPPAAPSSESNPETFRIALDWLRVGNVMVTALPRRSLAAQDEILLPHLSALDFRLSAAAGDTLRLGQVREYGRPLEQEPRLIVRIQTPAGVEVVDLPVPDDRFIEPAAIPLRLDGPANIRVTLMAVPPASYLLLQGHEAEQDAGIGLLGARVTGGS